MNLKKYLIFTLVLSFFYSCSIQKKRYSIGYTVQFNKKAVNKKSKNQKEKKSTIAKTDIVLKNNAIAKKEVSKEMSLEKQNLSIDNESTVSLDIETKQIKNKIQNTSSSISSQQNSPKRDISTSSPFVKKNMSQKIKRASKKTNKSIFKNKFKDKSLFDDTSVILLYILCFFIPFVAVGIVTDWEVGPVILNILLCCLCGIPGIIHALIVVSKNT